jgi:tetratricopeptide (TPR) repeat protein
LPAQLSLGVSFYGQGAFAEAKLFFEKAIADDPSNLEAIKFLGLIAIQTKNFSEAELYFSKLIGLVRGNAQLHSLLAAVFSATGRSIESLAQYEIALSLDPRNEDALFRSAAILSSLDRFDEALARYSQILQMRPGDVSILINMSILHMKIGNPEQSLSALDEILLVEPDHATAHFNKGVALVSCQREAEALHSFMAAIEIRPNFTEALSNIGVIFQKQKQFEQALKWFGKALLLDPRNSAALNNCGLVLHELKQFSDAIGCFNKAVAVNPSDPEIYWNRSLSHLQIGNFSEGWQDFEWRLQRPHRNRAYRFSIPQWDGMQPLEGKKVFIWGEQGLGDHIQFARFIPLVSAKGAAITLEVSTPLVRLLSGFDGVEKVIPKSDTQVGEAYDFHCSLMSLPFALKVDLDNLPNNVYLKVDDLTLKKWKGKVDDTSKPRVGIMWSGAENPQKTNRSIELEKLISLFEYSQIDWISLQKEIRGSDQLVLSGNRIIKHFGFEQIDFLDAAALCELCDLVISVDTSVAHLAGALGRPAWVLLPFAADWRWLERRTDSPWYPTVRLFRQTGPDDWAGVVRQVSDALFGWLAGRKQ